MIRIAVALVLALGMASTARAGVEVGGTAGIHIFSETNALGTQKNDPVHLANSALFGARLGIYFTDMLGVEAEGGFLPTETAGGSNLVDVFTVVGRANLIAQFRAADPGHTIIPFVTLGGGIMKIVQSTREEIIRLDTDGFAFVGIGAKYRAGGGWGVRVDARVVLPPDNTGSTFTTDFEILAALYREFGRKTGPKTEPAKKEDDPDKDGIVGEADKCPTEPEDKDEFEDENGCPDPDNDADGIPDKDDKCPGEPEDKDNHKDDDGCPDPDNDEDGIPDAADKCIDDPETKNGFEDENGCPDEVPAALAKFTGTIQGITFKVNSADLLPASNKTLDKAVAVLNEFKDVKLEIQGHTDDQPLKKGGKFADNDALSQARAESVKAYFVTKGVAEDRVIAKGYGSTVPVEDPTTLKGKALATARAKNRRVEFKLIAGGEAAGTEPKAEDKKPEEKKDEPKGEEKKDAPKGEEKKEEKKKTE